MIYKHSIITLLLIFIQTTKTIPDYVIIDIDDKKTKEQESLLNERRKITNYINQQQRQQCAKYEEITDCCCLASCCIPSLTHLIEPFSAIPSEIPLLSALSVCAVILAVDRYNQPDLSRKEERIRKIDEALKEKFE